VEHEPFLAIFFESVSKDTDSQAVGTETFTEVRREETDRDFEALAHLGTETGTHARREEGDRDVGESLASLRTETAAAVRRENNGLNCELLAGTETFTKAKGEEGDTDIALDDDESKQGDSPGIWESPIL